MIYKCVQVERSVEGYVKSEQWWTVDIGRVFKVKEDIRFRHHVRHYAALKLFQQNVKLTFPYLVTTYVGLCLIQPADADATRTCSEYLKTFCRV